MEAIIRSIEAVGQAGFMIGAAFLVLVLMGVGFAIFLNTAHGMEVFKKHLTGILLGSLLIFSAVMLGAWIVTMFA